MDYDAVVFDNDGILARLTERDAVRSAIANTLVEFGVEDPPQEDIERLFGVTIQDVLAICSKYDLDPADFWRRRDQNVAAAQIDLINDGEKGLYEDVSAINQLDVPLGVVSNNQHETVEHVLEYHGLADRFRTVYGRQPTLEDVRRKKPQPYYLERALADLNADRALYVGDSQSDVLAAHRAGIDSAFVRRPHRRDVALDESPTYEVQSLDTLVDRITTSAGRA